MKRSEMLKIIEDCWADSTSFKSDRSISEFILKAIEVADMLPPNNDTPMRSLDCIFGESEAGRKMVAYALMDQDQDSLRKMVRIWDSTRDTYFNKVVSPFYWEDEDEEK